tara:strand:+ start:18165 stop:20804 length:2640 start_codon:yes stop_codon:yes gene_type:complete
MATYEAKATLASKAYFGRNGVATLASVAHVRGSLHQSGETNSIGLVMMGGVELNTSRNVVPSGTNREYGYWRGGYNKTFLGKFDQAFFPLEGSGLYAGVPQVTVTQKSTSSGGDDESSCSEGVGSGGCVWMWDGAEWDLYADMCADGGKPGCGCEGTNPTYAGDFPMHMVSIDCVGGSTSSSAGGVGNNVGYAEWARAGTLTESLGQQAPQQRALFLSKRSFVSAGSGVDLTQSTGYSVYAKVVPSGDITGTVIIAQHREDPAQFILGCDYDGKYYIRSDHTVSGVNSAVYAKSNKGFEDYQHPAHIVGVYASGDSKLKIYVNGQKEGESHVFIRDKKRGSNSNVVLGKREFGLAERGFTGWVDEAGVSSRSFSQEDIKSFHDNTFNITNLIFNANVTPTGDSGLSGTSFGDAGIDALNDNYIEFVVDSGVVGDLNPTGARGGAFDRELWGQENLAISSVLTFDLTEIPTRFYSLQDLSVDVWVEHLTNHPSGADLSARLIHKDKHSDDRNLMWHASGVSVPSGSKRLIQFSHPLKHSQHYRGGSKSFRQDFDDHQIELTVKYPKTSLPYDANFKIFSSKLNFTSYDTLASFNTIQGLVENGVVKGHGALDIDGNLVSLTTGDRSLTLYSFGASPIPSSTTMNMFVDVGTADQALNLILNHDLETDMGSSAVAVMSGRGGVSSNYNMNLFTEGGTFNKRITLFLKTNDPLSAFSPTLPLEIAGTELAYPRDQKLLDLYLFASTGEGSPSGEMNLVMPKTMSGPFFDKRLLFVEGRQPASDIPLYVQVNESGIKTIPLYTAGPDVYNGSGIMNLFVKQKTYFGTSSVNAIPTIVGTGHIPLYIQGHGFLGSTSTTSTNFVIPNTLGSGTNTTTLTTRGYL